jgi:hypothetical protein
MSVSSPPRMSVTYATNGPETPCGRPRGLAAAAGVAAAAGATAATPAAAAPAPAITRKPRRVGSFTVRPLIGRMTQTSRVRAEHTARADQSPVRPSAPHDPDIERFEHRRWFGATRAGRFARRASDHDQHIRQVAGVGRRGRAIAAPPRSTPRRTLDVFDPRRVLARCGPNESANGRCASSTAALGLGLQIGAGLIDVLVRPLAERHAVTRPNHRQLTAEAAFE